MLPAARLLDQRHCAPGAVEHAVQVDSDAAVPVCGREILDLPGRAGDAGVVDEHVQPAECPPDVGEETIDVGDARDVGDRLRDRRQRLPGGRERGGVDVADVHARAVLDEGPRDRAADAGRACRDEDAQALRRSVHSVSSRCRRQSVARPCPIESGA